MMNYYKELFEDSEKDFQILGNLLIVYIDEDKKITINLSKGEWKYLRRKVMEE